MSHFLVYAIVPKGVVIESHVERLMEPYNEARDVPPYDHKCYCVGKIAKRFVEHDMLVKRGFNTLEEFRNSLPKVESKLDKDGQPEFEWPPRAPQEWKMYWDECDKVFAEHPQKNDADPTCDECKGTGFYKSTYNPDSKWDWYMIGGRWDGAPKKLPALACADGFNFSDECESEERNSCPIEELVDKYPYAWLLPDGAWAERGKMGWWGLATDEVNAEIWERSCDTIIAKYPGHLVVALDCHI